MELPEEPNKPLSVAERVKRYRDKRKQEIAYKQEESKRIEELRQLKVRSMSDKQLSAYKAAARERKRRSRELKRRGAIEGDISNTSMKKSYRSHYVKKTVKNTYKMLPRSPAERAEVLSKLAEQALMKLQAQASAAQSREMLEQSGEIEYQEKI